MFFPQEYCRWSGEILPRVTGAESSQRPIIFLSSESPVPSWTMAAARGQVRLPTLLPCAIRRGKASPAASLCCARSNDLRAYGNECRQPGSSCRCVGLEYISEADHDSCFVSSRFSPLPRILLSSPLCVLRDTVLFGRKVGPEGGGSCPALLQNRETMGRSCHQC